MCLWKIFPSRPLNLHLTSSDYVSTGRFGSRAYEWCWGQINASCGNEIHGSWQMAVSKAQALLGLGPEMSPLCLRENFTHTGAFTLLVLVLAIVCVSEERCHLLYCSCFPTTSTSSYWSTVWLKCCCGIWRLKPQHRRALSDTIICPWEHDTQRWKDDVAMQMKTVLTRKWWENRGNRISKPECSQHEASSLGDSLSHFELLGLIFHEQTFVTFPGKGFLLPLGFHKV